MNLKKWIICILAAITIIASVPAQASGKEQNDTSASEYLVSELQNSEKKQNMVTKAQKQVRASRKVMAKSKRCTPANIRLLASIIYCEAGDQSYSGKLAVGIVVMNRVRSSSYPNTVKGVIYQKSQFGPSSSGWLKETIKDYKAGNFTSKDHKQCIKAAKEALKGAKSITIRNSRKTFSGYYGFNCVKPSGKYYKLGGHYFRK